jgi:hypothetical protein
VKFVHHAEERRILFKCFLNCYERKRWEENSSGKEVVIDKGRKHLRK